MFRCTIVASLLVAFIGFGGAAPAAAQTRPALVRNVDEPARVPYSHSLQPTCPFTNSCEATFPVVPAGKRLRLTSVSGLFIFTSVAGVFALHRDPGDTLLLMFPASSFNGAYYGSVVSARQEVDFYYEAGESPKLEFGVPAFGGSIFNDARNRLSVSGYLVDVP